MTVGLGAFTGQTMPGPDAISNEYRANVSLARRAEMLGFDAVWFSEHHGASDGYFPSLMPMLGAVAAVTERITLGTATLLPSLHDKRRLAGQIATVDHLSAGRTVLGFGAGWRRCEAGTFGVSHDARAEIADDTIRFLRSGWMKSDQTGDVFVLDLPPPFAGAGPPILLYGSSDDSFKRAGALADGLIYSLAGPTAARNRPDIASVTRALGIADWERARSGRAGPIPLVLLTNAVMAPIKGAAAALAGVKHLFANYGRWQDMEKGRDTPSTDTYDLIEAGQNTVFVGSPTAILDGLIPWIEAFVAMRPLHLAVKLTFPGMTLSECEAVIEAFAATVIPKLPMRHAC
jgi:alkanesulfonate monooxygenase SsuD/methylene tetrahydromethanopterin reductase-like flavin-dependent oxidoreductase (luciferase family)